MYNFWEKSTSQILWDFCWCRISAGFGKSAGFRSEPEPKSGTALDVTQVDCGRWRE